MVRRINMLSVLGSAGTLVGRVCLCLGWAGGCVVGRGCVNNELGGDVSTSWAEGICQRVGRSPVNELGEGRDKDRSFPHYPGHAVPWRYTHHID